MGFFSFFKKLGVRDKIPELTVEEMLQRQLDLISHHYKEQPQFTRIVESLAKHENKLALEELIALAMEYKHYFSKPYWDTLAHIADRLMLPMLARYCAIEGLAAKRWQEDKVEKMRRVDGFHYRSHGRGGMIYYIQQGRVLELYYEMSGVKQFDLLIYFAEATHWVLPVKQVVLPEEKAAIREQLTQWLGKVRADY
jgi:hypothetical protein